MSLHHRHRLWFEFVDSKSNWADGISRDLGHCAWVLENGFDTREVSIPVEVWRHQLKDAWELVRSILVRSEQSSVGNIKELRWRSYTEC